MGVLLVVVHLGLDGGCDLGFVHLENGREGNPRRLEIDERSERVEEHGAGRVVKVMRSFAEQAWQDRFPDPVIIEHVVGTFIETDSDLFGAVITVAVSIVIAYLVDRIVLARGGRLAGQVTDVGVSRAAATRLRVVRRLIFVTIVVVGIGLALSQFTKLEKLATGLLASSAVLGIVLGLAARQVLANPLAGILLAITQPIRIGDTITLEDETGRVDDLTLSYTYIDTGDGRLMIVPNEKVVTNTVFNRSTGDQNAPVACSVWLPARRRHREGAGGARPARGVRDRDRRDHA